MSSGPASMDYFRTRARAYSKPTIEELRMLEYLKFQPQFQFQLTPDQYAQHREPRQVMFCDLTQFGTGLPTPEDSEMSGTENVEPWIQPQQQPQPLSPTTPSLTALTPHEPPSHISPRRPTKRKHLADIDANIPTQSPRPKRPRRDQHQHQRTLPPHEPTSDDKTTCMNCGRCFAPPGNRHNCIYHPGSWIRAPRTPGYWSCCRSSLTDCGCLVSRHRGGLPPRGGGRAATGLPGQHSQFAIMYRSGSLGRGHDSDMTCSCSDG